MKHNYITAALSAVLGLTGVLSASATTGLDLIVGFTQGGANSSQKDFFYDLGPVIPYPGATALYNGQTWNLGTYLTAEGFDLTQVQWGVFGNASTADGQSPQLTWITTGASLTPNRLNGGSAFNAINTPVNSILSTEFGVNGVSTWTSPGQRTNPPASDANSWNGQTVVPPSGPYLLNVLGQSPNVTGLSSDVLWQIADNNTAPVQLGSFTLAANGVLTFNVVSTAPPAPRIVSVTRTNASAYISFTTTNGNFTYKLYYTNAAGLTAPIATWPISLTSVTGNGQTNTLQDVTTDPIRFYRVGVK